MKLQGQIKVVKDTQVVSDKFQKRECVISIQDGNYTNDILVEFNNAQCSLLDNIQVNELVEIDVNLKGREWINPQGEAKYFNTINGWKITYLMLA